MAIITNAAAATLLSTLLSSIVTHNDFLWPVYRFLRGAIFPKFATPYFAAGYVLRCFAEDIDDANISFPARLSARRTATLTALFMEAIDRIDGHGSRRAIAHFLFLYFAWLI